MSVKSSKVSEQVTVTQFQEPSKISESIKAFRSQSISNMGDDSARTLIFLFQEGRKWRPSH